MENKRKSIIIGLSFLAAMVLFIWGFNFLKGKKLFHFQPYYYAVFDNAGGIEPANQVLVSGVSVGQVDDIYLNPDNDGTVILKFSINETIKIPENTVVSISSSLLGYSSVSLVLGNSTTVANVGDTLLSRTNMGVMNALSSQLIPLKDKVENLVMSLDTLTASLNALLDDGLDAALHRLGASREREHGHQSCCSKTLFHDSSSRALLSSLNIISFCFIMTVFWRMRTFRVFTTSFDPWSPVKVMARPVHAPGMLLYIPSISLSMSSLRVSSS